ncbi:jg7707 [Pararge aegeria aegeria]|uniref:Jg7707 protein n=1 Tax=Pararge aegeria aegeria TaxID=348720 RepID=A0A8S4RBS2_9NEOP|nr:jg7707 [Pararge aegeria aegeria]
MSGIKILVLFLPLLFLEVAHLKPDGFRKPQPGKPWVPPTLTNSLEDKYKQNEADPVRSFDLLYPKPTSLPNEWPTPAAQNPSKPDYYPRPEQNPVIPSNNQWLSPTPTTPGYNVWNTPAPTNQVNVPNGFRCPQAYGNFKYSSPCDEYVQCRNYIPLAYKCPAGLQFNRFALWTESPCDHPSKVQCYEIPAVQIMPTPAIPTQPTTPPTPTDPVTIAPRDFWCPQPHGYFKQSDHCGSYVECQNAVPRTNTCPFGLHFNPRVQWPEYPCDYPSRVQCNAQPDIPVTTSIATPSPLPTTAIIAPYPQFKVQTKYQCPQSNGFFRHNDQCGDYVECKNNIPRTYTCPTGLDFNPRAQWTDYPCEEPSKVQCLRDPAISIIVYHVHMHAPLVSTSILTWNGPSILVIILQECNVERETALRKG